VPMAEHDAAAADQGGPGEAPDDRKTARQLTPLGVPLEKARLASGLSTDAFLRSQGLYLRTWRRLVYGLPSATHLPPRDETVLRYGRAAGLPDAVAMQLADETFSPNTDDLTALGTVLEPARRRTGNSIRTFVEERGLTYTTYKRLIRRNLYHYRASQTAEDGWPPPATVRKYAAAAGVPLDLAESLAEQDRRARLLAGAEPGGGQNIAGQPADPGPADTEDFRA
jgi:hypothetical protein